MVARFVTAVITTLIPLVLARALPLSEYGTYKQLWLVAQTLVYVFTFGVPQSLYFFVPRTPENRPLLVQTLTCLLVAGVACGGLLTSGAGLLSHAFSNPELFLYRHPLGVYAGAMLASTPLEISLTSQGHTRRSAVAYLVSDSTRAAAVTLPVVLGSGLHGMMLAMAAFAVARLGVAWVVAISSSRGRFWDGKALRAQWIYAAPFGLAMALAIPQQYAHQYVVSALVPPAAFALYAVGCFQLPLVDLLYTPTSEVLMVRIGELERAGRAADARVAFREATARLAFAFVPLAAFFFVAAPEFISLAFGAKFLGAVPVFRVSLFGVVLAIAPLDGVLRARNQTRQILVSYLVKAAVTAPLLYLGVRFLGILGGIGSWAVAEVVGKATLLVKVPGALSPGPARPSLLHLLPGTDLLKAGAGAACGAGGVLLARTVGLLHGPWASGLLSKLFPLAAAAALFTVAYVSVLWLTGVRPWGSLRTAISLASSKGSASA